MKMKSLKLVVDKFSRVILPENEHKCFREVSFISIQRYTLGTVVLSHTLLM